MNGFLVPLLLFIYALMEWCITYDSINGGYFIRMSDDSRHQIARIGSVQLMMHDGIMRILTAMRHIIIFMTWWESYSFNKLDDKWYKYYSGDIVLKVSNGSLIVTKRDLNSFNLYSICGTKITSSFV